MNRTGWILALVGVVIIAAALALVLVPGKTKAPTVVTPAQKDDLIIVDSPLPGATISSPITITGKARGSWYFEASFPVELQDVSGAVLAQVPAQAQGDWMTTDYVPFTATLNFPTQPAGSAGTLILHNDNPSGLPQNDEFIEIPVVFK